MAYRSKSRGRRGRSDGRSKTRSKVGRKTKTLRGGAAKRPSMYFQGGGKF